MPDYRALYNQYSQGMQQPGVVRPNSVPGFNFLQGWSASPHAGYLPPNQNSYGRPPMGQQAPGAGYPGQYNGGNQSGGPVGAGINLSQNPNYPYVQSLAQYRARPNQEDYQADPAFRALLAQRDQNLYGQVPAQGQLDQFGRPINQDQINPGGSTSNPWGGG